MTDENSTPPPERSWAQETGWPTEAPTPSWAEPVDVEEDPEGEAYDAWLEAQDSEGEDASPGHDQEPADLEAPDEPPAPAVPVVVPDALEAAATPLEIEPAAPLDEAETAPSDEAEAEPALDEVEAEAGVTVEGDEPQAAVTAEQDEAELPAEEAELPAVPATRSGTPLVASLAVLVVLLAVATAVLGVASVRTRGGGDVEDARRNALEASRNAARLVFSYDYRHLDKDFAAGKAVTTGKFAADYARTTSKLVDDVAGRYKAVVVADVSDAAVVTAGKDRVVTLVFLNQRSTSSLAAGPKITQSRVTMVLVRKDGRWLVSEVNAF